MGWTEIADHYRTNYRCVARWIRQAGDEILRWERCFVTGSRTRPHIYSQRYADAAPPPLAPELRPVHGLDRERIGLQQASGGEVSNHLARVLDAGSLD
jgi:hypothetical protein